MITMTSPAQYGSRSLDNVNALAALHNLVKMAPPATGTNFSRTALLVAKVDDLYVGCGNG